MALDYYRIILYSGIIRLIPSCFGNTRRGWFTTYEGRLDSTGTDPWSIGRVIPVKPWCTGKQLPLGFNPMDLGSVENRTLGPAGQDVHCKCKSYVAGAMNVH